MVNKRVWNEYLDAISKTTEWSLFVSKANHSISQWSKPMPQPVMLKKRKLNSSMKNYKTQKRCPFHYRGLECKSRKSRNTWSNRQIWPWSTEWSRAKANRVLPREHTDHSKHPLPTAQEKTLHRHHQMVDTEIRLILFFAAKDGEARYGQQNKTGSWLWLRSWTPYCQIQTSIEESRENHLTIQVWKWKWSRSVVSNSLRPRGL